MTCIYVSEPNFWWRVDAVRIRKFVPVDPETPHRDPLVTD
jgi:hypothetical protein